MSNSLGISSLILGIISFLVCWVPFLGFGLSGLGFLLGVVAIVVAMSRGGSGVGYGITGVALNSMGVLLGIFYLLVILSIPVIDLDAAKKQIEDDRKRYDEMSSNNSGDTGNSVLQPEKTKTLESGDGEKSRQIFSSTEPKVTKLKFNRIQNGMSYRDVVNILGASGEELSSNRIEGVPGVMKSVETAMYMWKNPDGSNMNAMFQNGKLMQKSQFGLK